MSGEVVPAQRSLPDLGVLDVDHFERMPAPVLVEWLDDVVPRIAHHERMTTEYRRETGRALHELASKVGEAEYADHAQRLASLAGLKSKTVNRWRTEAQEFYDLPAPTKRTAARRARPPLSAPSAKLSTGSQVIDAGSTAADEQSPPAPVAPPTHTWNAPSTVRINPPKKAPAPAGRERCVRCENCPKCDGSGYVEQPTMRPFGR